MALWCRIGVLLLGFFGATFVILIAAINAVLAAMHKSDLFWFICWAMLMRFNRSINSQLLRLWNAQAGSDFNAILESVKMCSITSRGNEDAAKVKDRLRTLHAYFKTEEGQAVAEENLASLKAGTACQTVVESFPLPEHLRPYGFKKAENNFKPYFVGNIITLSSMLGLRRASPDGSLLIAPCRCGQAVQHCLNIIALSSMFGLRRASPDGFTFRFDVRCLGTQAGSGGAFQ